MLIGIFALVALLTAVLLCLGVGAFAGLAWLWILPVMCLVTFLLLIGAYYLMMLLMAQRVNMEKKQEKDSKWYRWVLQRGIAAILPLLGVRVHREGFDQPIPQGRFMLVCNHLHDIDPAFLLRYFPNSQLAFIAKKEVAQMPLVGPFLKKTLGQFVNRENDRDALRTILECIRLIKEDLASVAVFPEGYIHPERLLYPFRPGVFKIAQKTKVPIVVCTLRDTHKALPSVLKLKGADVHLHLVGIIPPEELEGVTTVEISYRVHDMMARDLGPDLVLPAENT